MARNDTTSTIIDGILKILVTGTVVSTAFITPNLLGVLDKPTLKLFKKLDQRQQERELRRVLRYMERQKLISSTQKTSYEYGIALTRKGKQRLQSIDVEDITIHPQATWDQKWRLVFYDVPEKYRPERNNLVWKLQKLGFYQMQRSVWVYPYPCRDEIEAVTGFYKINAFVTYIETEHIDNEDTLAKKFRL